MRAKYQCFTCKGLFERARPDANRQNHCSLRCRWESYVEKTDNCWRWTGTLARNCYGVLRVAGKTVTAHRLALELVGVDPEGMFVLHSCDNRICVNPSHLRLGTQADNINDMMQRNRHAYQNWSEQQRLEWLNKILLGQKQSKLQHSFA
jgi:hypothetical protein